MAYDWRYKRSGDNFGLFLFVVFWTCIIGIGFVVLIGYWLNGQYYFAQRADGSLLQLTEEPQQWFTNKVVLKYIGEDASTKYRKDLRRSRGNDSP